VRAKPVYRAVLGLLGMALVLAAIGAWSWSRRRHAALGDAAAAEAVPVAVPVTPVSPRAPVPVPVTPDDVGTQRSGAGLTTSGSDAAGPDGWAIKAKESSGLYHTPSSPSWERMHADAWFESEAAAEAAGYKPWDWRRRTSPGIEPGG